MQKNHSEPSIEPPLGAPHRVRVGEEWRQQSMATLGEASVAASV